MIVTFCGHAQFVRTQEYEKEIFAFLEQKVGNGRADFYLGDMESLTYLHTIAVKNTRKITRTYP